MRGRLESDRPYGRHEQLHHPNPRQHPAATDFTEGGRVALYHALKAALVAKSKLTLLHVSPGTDGEWTDFPGMANAGALAITSCGQSPAQPCRTRHQGPQIIAQQGDPVKTVLRYPGNHSADLIVLATHQHEGRAHWLRHSVAGPVARQSAPSGVLHTPVAAQALSRPRWRGVLGARSHSGKGQARPQPAIEAAARLAAGLNCPRGDFHAAACWGPDRMPTVRCPDVPGWEWKKTTRTSEVICRRKCWERLQKSAANLMVITTDSRDGFFDALRGSHSERVLRHAPAPVLVVRVGSLAERISVESSSCSEKS